ncbi:MAG TPA: homogentisate 1,2-dioxygenase [Acidimicrobiales bacterium]|nr:homogentisate 1,2-dioxygenase [Acidimicrobiales bacterium]
MPYYRCLGEVPEKRHTRAGGAGARLHEELMGLEGFSQASSLLYHRHSPSAIVAAEPLPGPLDEPTYDRALEPRHLRTFDLPIGGDPVLGCVRLLENDDVAIGVVAATDSSGLYRDALGDQLLYVQSGRAVLESSFGSLAVGAGDYVVIPRSTTHRWVFDAIDGGEPLRMLVVEARSAHIQTPARYLNAQGQFVEGAPYCERDLRAPTELLRAEGNDVDVLVRHRGGLTRLLYAEHPFDVMGWDGCVYPYAFNIRDFQPIVGQVHQPPPVHQTFQGGGFVVCSFVPRPYDFHPDAIKVPYHHANVDSEEILYYSGGDFMSRAGSGIGIGSMSYHPAGFVHGPQPGSVERSEGQDRTDELAVMIDTFRPLRLSEAARSISADDYAWSWARRS